MTDRLGKYIHSVNICKEDIIFHTSLSLKNNVASTRYWSHRGVVAKVQNCNIVVSEFEIQSRYYVHFRTNTLKKNVAYWPSTEPDVPAV